MQPWQKIQSVSLSPYYTDRQFCLKGILKAGVYVEYEGLAFVSATRPTSKGWEDAADYLPSSDFKRLDSMLNWVETDDMVYIESWEDIKNT